VVRDAERLARPCTSRTHASTTRVCERVSPRRLLLRLDCQRRWQRRTRRIRHRWVEIRCGVHRFSGGNGGDQLGLVFGQIAVTQRLMPALIRSKGRVVNIGSVGGKIAVATYGPYAGTKFEPTGA
jgi:short chain dehydrogenase